jgi:hypothetical protein
MQAFLAGHPPSVILHRISQAVPQSVLSSAKFWPVVTALNFSLVPPHLRFAFSAGFAVVWQTYLSFLNRLEEKSGPRGRAAVVGREKLLEEAKAKIKVKVKAKVKAKVNPEGLAQVVGKE